MSHPDPELLSAYLDGEVDPAEAASVAGHLPGCEACRLALGDLADARSLVRHLPMVDPGLSEMSTSELAVVVPLRRGRRRKAVWVSAAAAAALVAVLGLTGGGEQPTIDLGSVADQHVARATVDPGVLTVRAVTAVNQP